ncbi:MAG: nitrite/sulfite reductase [Romboutsia sp.]
MELLKEMLSKEIPQFREIGHKFVNKEISVNEFKGISGGMGVYAQRGGESFMIRLRIPSGIMDVTTLKNVYEIAKSKNLETIHLTTRQAIQLHGLSIDEVCDIMEECLSKDIYTRGGGGNFPRNVSISPLSGVDPNEEFDVTEYAMAVNHYFMDRITTYKLPRKLKVSFSSGVTDTGNSSINDLGFMAVKENVKEYFKLYIGGGLGKNAAKSVEFYELVEKKDVLYYVEAMVNLFIAEGNYENKNKARTRYIVEKMGEEAFLECYKKHLSEVKESKELELDIDNKVYNKEGIEIDIKHPRLYSQKQDGLYTVYYHPINGQLSLNVLKMILEIIDVDNDIELRLSMGEGMYIRNLNGEEAKTLLEATQGLGGETRLEQSIACIGVPTCQIGIAESQKMLEYILDYFKEKNFNKDILPKIHISGCQNSCGTHQIGKIGFTGNKRRIDDVMYEAYEIHVGGNVEKNHTKLGEVYGDIKADDISVFLYDLATTLDNKNVSYEDFITSQNKEFRNIIDKYLI